jgi:putative endonuclease
MVTVVGPARRILDAMYVYILASKSRVLYVGVTEDLGRRLHQHRTGKHGFTSRYRVHRLVYVEEIKRPTDAYEREERLKRWLRSRKIRLITASNPAWDDLSDLWGVGRAKGRKIRSSAALRAASG